MKYYEFTIVSAIFIVLVISTSGCTAVTALQSTTFPKVGMNLQLKAANPVIPDRNAVTPVPIETSGISVTVNMSLPTPTPTPLPTNPSGFKLVYV